MATSSFPRTWRHSVFCQNRSRRKHLLRYVCTSVHPQHFRPQEHQKNKVEQFDSVKLILNYRSRGLLACTSLEEAKQHVPNSSQHVQNQTHMHVERPLKYLVDFPTPTCGINLLVIFSLPRHRCNIHQKEPVSRDMHPSQGRETLRRQLTARPNRTAMQQLPTKASSSCAQQQQHKLAVPPRFPAWAGA